MGAHEPTAGAARSRSLLRWLDSWAPDPRDEQAAPREIDWLRVVPFLVLHLACGLVLVVGVSPAAVLFALASYLVRMFGITAFYHRYFSHRAFRTSRAMQLVGAVLGLAAVQRGPLWWAAHHRAHHRASDGDGDPHSPRREGFWWSHVGWVLARGSFRTRTELVPDLARYPELRFLDRFDVLVPFLYALGTWGTGALLARVAPGLGTDGPQLFVWGFCVSTVCLYHVTFAINSFAHRFGKRPFETRDDSRNVWWLALPTLGEGWHNNHHRHPSAARQGLRWWELDPSYYALWCLARLGLVRDLRAVRVPVRGEVRR